MMSSVIPHVWILGFNIFMTRNTRQLTYKQILFVGTLLVPYIFDM